MFIWYLIPRIRGESFPESVVPNFQNRWGVISRIRGESFQDFASIRPFLPRLDKAGFKGASSLLPAMRQEFCDLISGMSSDAAQHI